MFAAQADKRSSIVFLALCTQGVDRADVLTFLQGMGQASPLVSGHHGCSMYCDIVA